ncbi:signal recognition particle receptor FtsY [Lentilactobacillus fungorum]|uniref:Signal recognition particle receptor FtsY n=1 Tax=Lentilactobacillus fungorum TaxID=2201250 RepID=A0ABQ3VWX4_9LACO|nr:signal recognition particle-docking protein FtsY [Lentilactobacillus fungorum]GHP12839.1 signal recognition particle receptor FtsY [Lentilactobacillus fungorum]
MGLFDIFKRRSKKDQEKQQAAEKQPGSQAQSESAKAATTSAKPSNDEISKEAVAPSQPTSQQPTVASEAAQNSTGSQAGSEEAQPVGSQAVKAAVSAKPDHETTTTAESTPAGQLSDQGQENFTGSDEPATPITSVEPANSKAGDSLVTSDRGKQAQEQPETDTTASYERGLAKSRSTFGQKLNALLANFRHVDEGFFDDLEDLLIESDVGFETSMRITDELREEVKLQNAKKPKDVQNVIVQKLIDMYDQAGNGEDATINMAESGPTVLLFVGVNGVGKTTTIGKMAKMYKNQGKKVVLAAADTFRAGAIEQLNVWAERDGVDIVKGKPKSDPSSVVFDAVKKARDESYDVLLVDTAGRLQNKVNLMNELSKMKKILTREIPAAPHEVLLVLDATTGQNAMTQAKMFKEATDVTGIVLTKLDGTARGGIVLAIRSELHLPVKYVGLGEKVTDLKPFDPNDFVYGLFKGLISE